MILKTLLFKRAHSDASAVSDSELIAIGIIYRQKTPELFPEFIISAIICDYSTKISFTYRVAIMKCRKCRQLLFFHPEVTLFNGHGESYSNPSVKYISCGTIQEDNIWFLQDNSLPQWISDVVNNSNWTKGKVNCPNCQGRLGSFDFVSGTQCQCGSHVLPPVHIVKCKVDCRNQG